MGERNKREVGARYERVAAEYLEERGYEILERNYRNRYGELDLIARDGKVLVYVEIKFRASARHGSPLEAVDQRKQRRISKVAAWHYAHWGEACQGGGTPCRFDVIGIWGDGTIEHVKDAFPYQGSGYLL